MAYCRPFVAVEKGMEMKQKGLTLIELMVVVAILGILVTLAVPAYRDHAVKARVSEGLYLTEGAKLAVAETAMTLHVLPNSQAETGYVSPAPTANVQSIKIASHGTIVISYTELAGNGTLIFAPTLQDSGELTWDCMGGSLAKQYRPSNCRGES